jgi:molybdate transport system regulatory protein
MSVFSAQHRWPAALIPIAVKVISKYRQLVPSKPVFLSIDPRLRINYGRRFAFGPGKAELLEHIDRTGSISEAAKAMGMSYMRAWTLVKSLDRGCAEPLVNKSRGGSARGGATLSPTGRRVLGLYREMETASKAAIHVAGQRLNRLLKPKADHVRAPHRRRP